MNMTSFLLPKKIVADTEIFFCSGVDTKYFLEA